MRLFWVVLAILSFTAAVGQNDCPEYNRLIEEATTFFKQGDYRRALNKYNSAKTCSPSNRAKVDIMINSLFEKIENERREAKKLYQQLKVATETAKAMELEKKSSDSTRIADNFTSKNKKLVDKLTAVEKKELLRHVVSLNRIGVEAASDTLVASLQLIEDAKVDGNTFLNYLLQNVNAAKDRRFFENKSTAISDLGHVAIDIYYYRALAKISEALSLLPVYSRAAYERRIQMMSDSLKQGRYWLQQNYWMPDSVIVMQSDTLFAFNSANNQNYLYGYSTYEDYKKVQLRFINLSVKDFSFTTDSLVQLNNKGKFYRVLAADPDYRYMVVKDVAYALKKNLAAYQYKYDVNPVAVKLIDKNGNILNDFSNYSPVAYYFTPNANFIATWKNNSNELVLYNLKSQKFSQIPDADAAVTMSFSSDSKTMVYYNTTTKHLCFLDLNGTEPNKTAEFSPGIGGIWNIDFTGSGNNFLKINTTDSTILYDIRNKKVVFQFQKDFVKNIVVAPDNKEALVTCNRYYSYSGYLSYLVDMDLNIKDRLYSDCDNFFFTPDGSFVVGYDKYVLMRWSTDRSRPVKNFQTCISFTTLLERECLPLSYFMATNDADEIEQGARKYYSMAEKDTANSILQKMHFRESQLLFDRLKLGEAQNINKDRIPFFYDWSNYLGTVLGDRDFINQFSRQKVAVEVFDKLVSSTDSVYPQQLFYAANGNMLLGNLYDSLHAYNLDYAEQLKKEISLREKVFDKDQDNDNNTWYFRNAFKKLSNVCDTVGWRNLQDKQYIERLALYRDEERYLSARMKSLPDSFGLKNLYINVLAQLAPSYLYAYANKPGEYASGLDSALYFTEKAFSLSPADKFDSARLLVVKARVYLLKENGPEKALELYRLMKTQFPNQITKAGLLGQLRFLREAGSQNPNISRAEEFLKQEIE